MKINLKKLILDHVNIGNKQETYDKKKQIIECLSWEKDSGYNVRKKEWREKYQEIRNQYTQIRLHKLWSTRIGEYIVRYLAIVEDSKENEKKGILDLFVLSDCINHNERLSIIMGRNIHIIDKTNIDMWMYILYRFPKVAFSKYWNTYAYKKKDRIFDAENTVQYFRLTQKEKQEAQYKKEMMGLQGSFVCVSCRDAAYLETILPTIDCHYHDFRDSDINKFASSADYLSRKGISVVRMGRFVKNRVEFDNCIDYANDYYDELLDIILAKDCKFYVGDSSGIVWLPMVLNRPIALRNWIPVFLDSETLPYNPHNLLIFKKYFSKNENRFLSVKEMMEIEKKVKYNGNLYEQYGIEVVENSEEEILDLVMEMNARLDGEWIETPEDIELQEKYQRIYKEWFTKQHYKESAMLRIKVGTLFLRKNAFLLNE